MNRIEDKNRKRDKRKAHIRATISGTASRPRLSVTRSNSHLYIAAIDDTVGKTLCASNTMQKEFKALHNTCEDALKLGEAFGKLCVKQGIKTAVFDRNGYVYHGIVKALADGARKAGLEF